MRSTLSIPFRRGRRLLFWGLVAGTTIGGTLLMAGIVQGGGFTALEATILALFAPTFGWITVAFWNAVAGFALDAAGRDPLTLRPADQGLVGDADGHAPRGRTAVVVPAFREDPRRLVAGLRAMARSLGRTGHAAAFDLWLLSDTPDSEAARVEEEAWRALREELAAGADLPAVHYRRRPANLGRKAGNVAEFCRRWGGAYDYLLVLDADSLMSGRTMVRLARVLDAHPEVGLVQTVPVPARQTTLFGRLLQVAAALYSPMLASGQAFWQTDAGNYWGHNAILRTEAWVGSCGLPELPGTPPLGGPILSHDFVEAALLRRAGWAVLLAPSLAGSFEEVPGNVVDYARRDRRWAQGSLQHLRLLAARGLHPVSRTHLFLGAMGYLASVLWLLVLVAGTVYVLAPGLGTRGGVGAAPAWLASVEGIRRVVPLLALTAVLLFLPKALGLVRALLRGAGPWGGPARLAAGAVLELLFSVVLAPVMMLYHALFVGGIVAGRSVRWTTHPRDGRQVGWGESLRRTGWIAAVGLAWTGLTAALSPGFLPWLAPIVLGLVLAPALVRWSSRRDVGEAARRAGLFLVPWETAPPPLLVDADDAGAEVGRDAEGPSDGPPPGEETPREATPPEAPMAMPVGVLHARRGPPLRHRPAPRPGA